MCEFKPGDEVVCVEVGPLSKDYLSVGSNYVLRDVDLIRDPEGRPIGNRVGVRLVGMTVFKSPGFEGKFSAHLFRKVQRRDLSAWLKTATKFEEPKRKKANA